MAYKITDPGFQNYTGDLGKTKWVNGKCERIDDRLDVDMIRITLGVTKEGGEAGQVPESPDPEPE